MVPSGIAVAVQLRSGVPVVVRLEWAREMPSIPQLTPFVATEPPRKRSKLAPSSAMTPKVSTFDVVMGPEHTCSQSGFVVPAPQVLGAGAARVPLHICLGIETHMRCG